jgi:hypothetical protein
MGTMSDIWKELQQLRIKRINELKKMQLQSYPRISVRKLECSVTEARGALNDASVAGSNQRRQRRRRLGQRLAGGGGGVELQLHSFVVSRCLSAHMSAGGSQAAAGGCHKCRRPGQSAALARIGRVSKCGAVQFRLQNAPRPSRY